MKFRGNPEIKLLKVDMQPFSKISWVSGAARDRWQAVIPKAQRLFFHTEILTVAEGLRAATTASVHRDNWKTYLDVITKHGLIFTPISTVKRYNGFAHKHEFVSDDDPTAMVYGCLSRTKEDGEAFKAYHENTEEVAGARHPSHVQIADLLGYPKCCQDFFWDTWVGGKIVDTPFHQAWNTPSAEEVILPGDEARTFPVKALYVKGHSHTAQHLRYFGLRITPHLPCSYTCQESIEWGHKWLDVMRQIDRITADDVQLLCQMPVKWSAFKGVGTVTTPIFRGAFNTVPTFPELQVLFESENDDVADNLPARANGTDFPFVRWGIMKDFKYLQVKPSSHGLKIKDLKVTKEASLTPDEPVIERVEG